MTCFTSTVGIIQSCNVSDARAAQSVHSLHKMHLVFLEQIGIARGVIRATRQKEPLGEDFSLVRILSNKSSFMLVVGMPAAKF